MLCTAVSGGFGDTWTIATCVYSLFTECHTEVGPCRGDNVAHSLYYSGSVIMVGGPSFVFVWHRDNKWQRGKNGFLSFTQECLSANYDLVVATAIVRFAARS